MVVVVSVAIGVGATGAMSANDEFRGVSGGVIWGVSVAVTVVVVVVGAGCSGTNDTFGSGLIAGVSTGVSVWGSIGSVGVVVVVVVVVNGTVATGVSTGVISSGTLGILGAGVNPVSSGWLF